MRLLKTDLSIFQRLDLVWQPVSVKFLFEKPEGIQRLDKQIALCEALKEMHFRTEPFYIDKENENCAGKFLLGMVDSPLPPGLAARIGVDFEIFQEPRVNRRIHEQIPTLPKGLVNYVVFSNLNKLTFEPDLLIVEATPDQAEIILRAMSYSTGKIWESKQSIVGACAWLFIYPYKTGQVNYLITGMSFGMKAKHVFPAGLILISIPYDWIPIITQNLKEMRWDLPAYTKGREWVIEQSRKYFMLK
ncbi:MAG: DUF169 domain-containing protein [Candidatus Bathyarchaeia archaeon]